MTEPTARIEAALSHLGSEHEPPAGWEARVIAAATAPRRRPWWLFATSALALAGAAVVFASPGTPDPAVAFTLDASVENGRTVVRGESPHAGDLLRATAHGGGYRAVWVYHHDQLVAACPGGAACRFIGDATIADVELSIGNYQIVALSSVVPLAPPRGAYDTDVANARTVVALVVEKPLIVR